MKTTRRLLAFTFTCLLASALAYAQSDAERLLRLEQAVRQLQQEKDELRREIEQLRGGIASTNVPAGRTSATETLPSTNRMPFVLAVGKETKLKLGGFIQASGEFGDPGSFEGNFADNPAGGPTHVPINDRFRLRRARINVSGEFLQQFDFKLEGEFEQGDGLSGGRTAFGGTDIFVNWHQFPEAQIKVGQFKSPFGLEHLSYDPGLMTAERSLVTGALTQDRQLGLSVWGKPLAHAGPKGLTNLVDYSFGIFNGNGRNTTFNDDSSFMYAGRIGITPYSGKLWGQPASWRLGVNGYTSHFASGTRVSPAGNLRLNPLDGSLSPFLPSGVSEGEGWGVDQWLTFGPFDLIAEYLHSDLSPLGNTSFTAFGADGYYLQGGYYLPFFGGKKLQLVTKWESFNPGQAEQDDIRSITGGLNYYISGDSLKLMYDYIHTWSDFRENHPGTGETEFDLFLVRFQAMF